eukprot:m51a1_g11722 hypothetical protein (489) ;mRNA; r:101022-103305
MRRTRSRPVASQEPEEATPRSATRYRKPGPGSARPAGPHRTRTTASSSSRGLIAALDRIDAEARAKRESALEGVSRARTQAERLEDASRQSQARLDQARKEYLRFAVVEYEKWKQAVRNANAYSAAQQAQQQQQQQQGQGQVPFKFASDLQSSVRPPTTTASEYRRPSIEQALLSTVLNQSMAAASTASSLRQQAPMLGAVPVPLTASTTSSLRMSSQSVPASPAFVLAQRLRDRQSSASLVSSMRPSLRSSQARLLSTDQDLSGRIDSSRLSRAQAERQEETSVYQPRGEEESPREREPQPRRERELSKETDLVLSDVGDLELDKALDDQDLGDLAKDLDKSTRSERSQQSHEHSERAEKKDHDKSTRSKHSSHSHSHSKRAEHEQKDLDEDLKKLKELNKKIQEKVASAPPLHFFGKPSEFAEKKPESIASLYKDAPFHSSVFGVSDTQAKKALPEDSEFTEEPDVGGGPKMAELDDEIDAEGREG